MNEETVRQWCRMFKNGRTIKCSRWREKWSAICREWWSFSKCKGKGKGKGKAIPVTGRGGPQCCETPRLPHFADSRFTDGDQVVSLTPAALCPQEDSWYSFLLEAESTQGPRCGWRDYPSQLRYHVPLLFKVLTRKFVKDDASQY
jgi:hypothetical protein